MSDVRSMLRNERAARRINHPQAQYSPAGVLSCKACRLQLKSDALWKSHISSPQHLNSLKGLASGLMGKPSTKGTKRKAEDDSEDEEDTSRKRKRATEAINIPATTTDKPKQAETQPSLALTEAIVDMEQPAVNEDEWAAFEREIASPLPEAKPPPQLSYSPSATISAAPVSATELASRATHNESVQAKERREVEVEQEKEDAQRRLEEEFDEMEELEARVQRLKDKREALRQHKPRLALDEAQPASSSAKQSEPGTLAESIDSDDGGDDDDDEGDDDWDNWGAF